MTWILCPHPPCVLFFQCNKVYISKMCQKRNKKDLWSVSYWAGEAERGILFPLCGADSLGASARRTQNKTKKGLKLMRSAASPRQLPNYSCKSLFWWRLEQETFGECKGKCIQKGRHVELICAAVLSEPSTGSGQHGPTMTSGFREEHKDWLSWSWREGEGMGSALSRIKRSSWNTRLIIQHLETIWTHELGGLETNTHLWDVQHILNSQFISL